MSYFCVPPSPIAERQLMSWVGGEPSKKDGYNFRVKCEDGLMLVVNSLMFVYISIILMYIKYTIYIKKSK